MSQISVVVPCYNVANCLSRCIESLLMQTMPVEIILVNDGSTDDTLAIANEYADKYENVRVVSKENQGLPQARKTGWQVVSTPYIGFVDSDDWVEPEMYERLYRALTETNSQIAACGTSKSYEDGKCIPEAQMLEDGTVLSGKEALHYLHCRRDIFPYMWNKLFCKELLESVVFPKGNFTGEDYVTLVQILVKCDRVVTVKGALHHYFQSTLSMSRGGFKDSHILSFEQYKKSEKWMIDLDPAHAKDICCYLSVEYMAYVIAMSRNDNYNYQILMEIREYIRRNLVSLLKNKDYPLLYKGCAIAFLIHHKLLTIVYKMLNK